MPRLSTERPSDASVIAGNDWVYEGMQKTLAESKARKARADVETSVVHLREAGVPVVESAADLVPLEEADLPPALSPAEEQRLAEDDALEVEDRLLAGVLKPDAPASDRAAVLRGIRESRRQEVVR